ncbi:MAG: hypothetical protein ACI92C_002375, partial [Neolewinella sp.]
MLTFVDNKTQSVLVATRFYTSDEHFVSGSRLRKMMQR